MNIASKCFIHRLWQKEVGKKTSFKKGDFIVWQGAHDFNPSRNYTGLNWAEKSDGNRLNMTEKEEGEILPSQDFSGLWKRSDYDPKTGKAKFNPHYKPPIGWPLSEKGKELVNAFHEDQNPMVNCGKSRATKSHDCALSGYGHSPQQ